MTALALIHSSDSDNKVTNEISDCPGIALVSVVKDCGPYIPAETCIIGESGIPLHQLFIYVLNFVFRCKTLDLRILSNANGFKE